MQQQIQINQPPERILSDAASFFVRRRAKVSDRTERGLRFGLPGGAAEDAGRVTISPGPGGVSTVTVQADGLGLLAIAEGFVRELRKQARDQDRSGPRAPREGGPTTMRGDFSSLRERLGMPAPERQEQPARPPRPQAVTQQAESQGPAPNTSTSGPVAASPEGARPADAAAGAPPPRRAFVPSDSGPAQAPVQPPEEQDAHAGRPSSAEQAGGVPASDDVRASAPSDTAKAHSGADGPETQPLVEPSAPAQGGTNP